MRHLWLAAVLTLAGAGAPLAAQENDAPIPAPAPSQPGPIVLVSGPRALTARLGDMPLDPAAELCLDHREEAVLASDRVTFTLTGKDCVIPATAEQATWDAYRAAIVEEARTNLIRAMYGEEPEALATARAEYIRVMREVMGVETDGMIELPPVEAVVVESAEDGPRSRKRVRTAAMRGTPPPPPPRPVIFRIASGSPAVLARFPRGMLVQRGTAICLKTGEQLNIAGSNGQSVSYSGPGCLNRGGRPTSENVGGFTFG